MKFSNVSFIVYIYIDTELKQLPGSKNQRYSLPDFFKGGTPFSEITLVGSKDTVKN